MASDGVLFNKIANPLVLHRIRKNSFTRSKQKNVFFKVFRVKLIFLFHEIIKGRINGFMLKTFFYAILDLVKGVFKMIKKRLRK
jgi:hypothetical protein